MMENFHLAYENLLLKEIKATPEEYLPTLLNIICLFRESVTLKPADLSFRKGWEEAISDETMPLKDLWDGINAE
jgi:hypothetical protein